MSLRIKTLLIFLLLFLLSVVLRVWDIDRDSPSVDILPDEATWTDEGTLALPALEAVRGDDLFSSLTTLTAGIHPFYSTLLYTSFKVLGPGRVQGRIVSILFGVLGLGVLTWMGRILWLDKGSLLALLFGGVGFFPVMFDRLILAEGPLVALVSLIALAGVLTQSALGGLIVGIGLGLIIVGIKLHALALLPALAVLYAFRRRRMLIPFLFGVGIVLLLWNVFWVPHVPSYTGYIENRFTEGQMGLAEPFQILFQIFFAGLPGYFFPYQIPLLFFACLEVMAFLLAPRLWLRNAPDLVIVALVWLPVALAGPSLFRYMPTRYFIPAFPALVVLAIAGIRRLWDGESLPEASGQVRVAIGIVMGLFFLFQVAPPLPLFGNVALWIPLLGLPSPLLFYWLTTRTRPGFGWSQDSRLKIITVLIAFHLLLQGTLYWFGVVQSRSDLPHAAAVLSTTLPSNAILTGRMAGTMALLSGQRASPIYRQIDSAFIDALNKQGPVWVLILETDEKLVTPQVQADLVEQDVFPVGFSYKVRTMKVWRVEHQ